MKKIRYITLSSVILLFALAQMGTVLLFQAKGFAEEVKEEARGERKTRAFELGQIVVTATKTERRAESLSTAVTVVTEDDIKNSTAQSVAELLKYLPGVTVEDTYGYGIDPRVRLRGFDSPEYTLVMIDGMPINTLASGYQRIEMVPLSNIERIEVIRGPASALWGGNACGGVVNIITKDVKPQLGAGEELSIGPHKMQHHRYFLQMPFFKESGLIFSGQYKEGDGWRDKCSYLARNYSLKWQKKDEDYKATVALSSSDKYQEYPSYVDEQQWKAGELYKATYAWCNGGHDLEYIQAIFEKDIGENSNLTSRLNYYNMEYDYLYYNYDPDRHDIVDEDRYDFGLQYNLDLKTHLITFGLDLIKGEVENVYREVTDRVITHTVTDVDKYALFVQDLWKIFERWEANLGLRYDYAKFDNISHRGSTSGSSTMKDWSPKFGLVFKATDNLNFYASTAKAFKVPDTYNMYTSIYRNPDLQAETTTNYEIGIKSNFKNATFNLSTFIMDVEDLIQLNRDRNKYENIGEVRQKGIEIEGNIRLARGLIASFSADWIRSKIKKYPSNTSLEGNYLQYVPRWKASLGLQYTHDSGFFGSINGRWVGTSYMHNDNKTQYNGHEVFDLKVGYEKSWKDYDFVWTLGVNNIFDKKYAERAYTTYTRARGIKKYYPGAPRTVMTTISIRY